MQFSSTRYFLAATLLSMLFWLGSIHDAQATHLRAGEITAVRKNCNSLTFIITVTVYTNTRSTVLFGGPDDILDFGDGSPVVLVPETPNTIRLDLNPDGSVATASFTIEHTYQTPGKYLITYREPNRNADILNMDASVNTMFFLQTSVVIDPFLGCNNTPRLLVAPIDLACSGVAWFHNPGAYDPDGDSLSYEMVVPFSDHRTQVLNYRLPNHQRFYTNYATGNEAQSGPPTFTINPVSGTILWDAPGAVGEYNIAFHIKEWRKINGIWFEMGYVRRDMQILVEDCDNQRPDLIIPADTCIEAGSLLEARIIGIDPDNHNVKIEAFSEIFNFPPAQTPATYTPVPGVNDFRAQPAETIFRWNTQCLHVKEQPYQVVFKITDKPDNGPPLVTFKTWQIKVVGPKPVWTNAQLDLSQRRTQLTWQPYTCQNAERMQVWRKVEGADFTPANCETGMPAYLGYELVGEVPINTTSFTDSNRGKGLAPGAKYCYRLVAVFPLPRGGESYVSEDICVGPILADAPVVTHVTIERTATAAGRIRVSWRSPFDANPAQFPPPYRYEVYRATGLQRGADSVLVSPANFSDTTFLDTGLNTEANPYNYSIRAIAANGFFVGNSAVASSVRLAARAQVQRIELTWQAIVPWTNQIQTTPNEHLIYRWLEGEPEGTTPIASVNVNQTGFIYVDEGQHDGVPLKDSQVYCYRVMTRGGYGNPRIDQPLENFSQVMCAIPGDTIPPCQPLVPIAVDAIDCDAYTTQIQTCNNNVFSNRLQWERRDDECASDVAYYNIYDASSPDGQFILLRRGVIGLEFEHTGLSSYARCYRISAVDRSGNESELSDPICFDNCPYFELPNVFSPNGDGCNDLFSAYREVNLGENGTGCGNSIDIRKRCPRFVQRIVFRVYNRWGREVYNYTFNLGSEGSRYIDWDGRSSDGAELSTGVYYYVAEVTFDAIDPKKRNQTYKGWVHLLRGEQ